MVKALAERAQLVIDRDAQSLKGPGGRVDLPAAVFAGDCFIDEASELRCGERLPGAHMGLDVVCDSFGPALLAVSSQQPLYITGREACKQVVGCLRHGGIHSHVNRTLCGKAEAPAGRCKLGSRYAQIKENAINCMDIGTCQQGLKVPKIALQNDDFADKWQQPVPGSLKSLAVTVDAHEHADCRILPE